MNIEFEKFQGAGNDFVIVDNRDGLFSNLSKAQIAIICDRNFGIGADGFIMITASKEVDFEMHYYNSDGQLSSMCGNGGRCAVAFAHKKKIIGNKTTFEAIDGLHEAQVNSDLSITLKMSDVLFFIEDENATILNTGSPHYVQQVEDAANIDVVKEGATIRYSNAYAPEGINVNFVEFLSADRFKIRTYERGVENETLACGTGAVAAALAMHHNKKTEANRLIMEALGGELIIDFIVNGDAYSNIRLTGPAQEVFTGMLKS